MTDAAWYAEMAEAMRTREKCLNAIARWQENLVAAEAVIEALRSGDPGPVDPTVAGPTDLFKSEPQLATE